MTNEQLDALYDQFMNLDDWITDTSFERELTEGEHVALVRNLGGLLDALLDAATDEEGNIAHNYGRVSNLGIMVEQLMTELDGQKFAGRRAQY